MTGRRVGDHIEVNKEAARAGQTGLGMRYVLGAGIVLVVIGFIAVAIGALS